MLRIKKKVFQKTGLTVSVGIGPNRLIAKLASEEKKPDGKFLVRKNKKEIREFLDNKKIIKIPGIGPSTEFLLKGLNIFFVKDLRKNLYIIKKIFSEKLFLSLFKKSIGFENCDEIYKETKNPSFYKSKTFMATRNLFYLKKIIFDLSEHLESILKKKKLKFKKISISIKFYNFKVFSKTKNLLDFSNEKKDIYDNGIFLLGNTIEKPIRLIGLKISDFLDSEKKNYFQNEKNFLKKKKKKN